MTTREQQVRFLCKIRQGPGFIGWANKDCNFRQQRFENEAEAISLIDRYSGTHNLWGSMASFPDLSNNRKSDRASDLKAFWFDVDAHEGSQYNDPVDCSAAIRQFVKATGLPRPNYLHATGHGIQALWVLAAPVSRAEWQPIAERLQALGKARNLGADPITADAARILRVPGTYNFRDPDKPRPTELHELRKEATELGAFKAAIETALTALPSKPVEIKRAEVVGIPDTSENVALVAAMLAKIDPDLDYPHWRNLIWAIASTGLSSGYDLVRQSSKAGGKWNAKADEALDRVWNSYNPDRENAVGFGTLVHHARLAGYTGLIPGEVGKFDKLDFPTGQPPAAIRARGLVTQLASNIEPEPVDWLVEGAIPLGMMVVIGGQPGMGKSQIAISLAAAITTGTGLPDGSKFTGTGSVVILANEDDAAHTIRPRLDAASADITKVHIVEGVAREGKQVDLFQLDTDIAALRIKTEEIGDVRLIIIDPPSAYLGPKVDAYKESDVRRVLAPLTQLAHDTGALVLLVVHLNKRSDGGAQQRFGGSTAWIAAPRAAFLVAEEEATRRRYMLPVKNNLGNDRLGFEYRVAETILNYRSGPIKAPFIEWLGTSNRSTTELLNPPKPKDTSALDEAKEFLNSQLAGGTKPAADVKAAATDAGISDATLNRAKTDLRVKSTKVENVWNWALRSIFND